MFVTNKALSRRTMLRGMGATLALPLLDAMVPALTPTVHTAAAPTRRFGAIFVPMGERPSHWNRSLPARLAATQCSRRSRSARRI